MKDTVAIIGSHPRTRADFDYTRTDCDVWVFNEAVSNKANDWVKRADVVFQMHEEAIWRNPANRNDPGHSKWLMSQNEVDVYMQDVYPDVPRSKKYPLDEIRSMIDNDPNHFLTSSVPQAMALAGYLGYKRVEVYGVAMETNTEYQFQREGVAYWYGWLKGHGISVYFADNTFNAPLYGYEGEVEIPYERFGERIAELRPALEEVSKEYRAHLEMVKKAFGSFFNDCSKDNEKLLFAVMERQCQIGEKLGIVDGALQENEKYKAKADKMREAADNHIFSRQEFESAAKTLQDRSAKTHEEFIAHGTRLGIIHDSIKNSAKGSPKRAKLAEEYVKQTDIYLQSFNQSAIFKGASQENFNYMAWLDKHIRAAGGEKSEAVLLEALQNA